MHHARVDCWVAATKISCAFLAIAAVPCSIGVALSDAAAVVSENTCTLAAACWAGAMLEALAWDGAMPEALAWDGAVVEALAWGENDIASLELLGLACLLSYQQHNI